MVKRTIASLVLVLVAGIGHTQDSPALLFMEPVLGVIEEIEAGDTNAAAHTIRRHLREQGRTLRDELERTEPTPYRTQYIAILLMLDGATQSLIEPELALASLYISGALYECPNGVCPFGTVFVSDVSSIMIGWTLSQQTPTMTTPTIVRNFYQSIQRRDCDPDEPPPSHGWLGGGTEQFIGDQQIPYPELLRVFKPIEQAIRVQLNDDSDQAGAFIDRVMEASGLNLTTEPLTDMNHFVMSIRTDRELAAQLLAATPALRERYDPAGCHTNIGETQSVTGGAVPCETTP